MDGYIYRRDLINSNLLLSISKRSDKAGALRLVSHLMVIILCGYLVWLSIGTWWLAVTSTSCGISLTFLFAPLHECIHGTAFRSKKANKILAAVAGFLLLLPSFYFRLFHFQHHKFTNNPKFDPELQTPKPRTKFQYFFSMSGLNSYWWPQLKVLVSHAAGRVNENFIPESRDNKIILEARLHVLAYLVVIVSSIVLQSYLVLIFWIIPVMLGMVFLRLFLLAEHAECDYTSNMMRNTRTTLTNPIVRFISWNMPYHCEHHLFPSVPFHMLPKLHNARQIPNQVISSSNETLYSWLT